MSGRLPEWIAERLGLSTSASADGATWQLDSAWNWAPWATLLLILFAVLWTALLYSREASGATRIYRTALTALRVAAIGLLLIMVAQWAFAVRITGPPAIAVVIDRSASMSIADEYDDPAIAAQLKERLVVSGFSEPTRLNQEKMLLTADDARVLRDLISRYRTEVYLAAGGVERLGHNGDVDQIIHAVRDLKSDAPDSGATRLGDGLIHLLDDFRGAPPAAIVLLTDGVSTAGVPLVDAAQDARRKGVPIFAVGIGRDTPPRDIELTDVLVDDVVFVGDLVSFQALVKASGLEGQTANVTLRREGSPEKLAEQAIKLPAAGTTLTVRLLDRPNKPGDAKYVVEVSILDGEINKQNNRQQRMVSVRDDKIRVLLIQGYPNYEFRFLKSLLERDRTIQLSTYLQDADPDYATQDKTALRSFPVERDELSSYDVVIVGDVDPRLVPRSAWQGIRTFVTEKGGGAAFIAGPRFLPWMYQENAEVSALLPFEISKLPIGDKLPADVTHGFEMQPTPVGLQSPAFQLGDTAADTEKIWHSLAPLYWLFPIEKLKPGAQVLGEGPRATLPTPNAKYPVICFQYFGAGRVLFHAIDSTWRWRIGFGDAYFARYWVQTIRFLARGKLSQGRGVELSTDHREYQRGEAVQIRARFFDPRLAPTDEAVMVALESPGQDRRRVKLSRNPSVDGVFDATLSDIPTAHYEALLVEPPMSGAPPAARFSVVAPPGEFAHPEMNSVGLTAASETTHGKFFTMANADRLLGELPAGRRVPLENLPPIPIWNRWWMLSAFLGCLTLEWVLRKRKGMM